MNRTWSLPGSGLERRRCWALPRWGTRPFSPEWLDVREDITVSDIWIIRVVGNWMFSSSQTRFSSRRVNVSFILGGGTCIEASHWNLFESDGQLASSLMARRFSSFLVKRYRSGDIFWSTECCDENWRCFFWRPTHSISHAVILFDERPRTSATQPQHISLSSSKNMPFDLKSRNA